MVAAFAYPLNLYVGWCSFLAGAVAGMIIGLRFHQADWLGGYDSFARRMVRLGHIAFFGLGFINILFAVSITSRSAAANSASVLLLAGAATMSLNCFLTAWRPAFRHAFFIPAGSTAAGIALVLVHLT